MARVSQCGECGVGRPKSMAGPAGDETATHVKTIVGPRLRVCALGCIFAAAARVLRMCSRRRQFFRLPKQIISPYTYTSSVGETLLLECPKQLFFYHLLKMLLPRAVMVLHVRVLYGVCMHCDALRRPLVAYRRRLGLA